MNTQAQAYQTTVFSAAAALRPGARRGRRRCAAAARAADDDVPVDQKFLRGIMEGLGLKRDGEADINYQERAPLVMPPSRDLPPPERTDAAIANNPAWPKDPDVARRKAEAAAERNRNISDEREREQNPLRPDQLTPGGRAKTKNSRRDGRWLSRTGLRLRQVNCRHPSSATQAVCSVRCLAATRKKR